MMLPLVLPLAGALAIQLWLGAARGWLDPGRASLALACLLLIVIALSRPRSRGVFVRVALSAAAAIGCAISALDLVLAHDSVHARGLLWWGFATLAAFTAFTIVLRPAPRSTATSAADRIATGLGVSLTTIALLIAAIESIFALRVPANLYEMQPDDPAMGEGVHVEGRRLVGTPNFRGRWMHPEFAGVRVQLNALGLRDDADESTPPPGDATSLLVLGDSFAFGCGVELRDTFQERLEARGAEVGGKPLRATCVAIPGNGQFDELEDLERWSPIVKPAAIVLAFCCTNDLEDNMRHEARALSLKLAPPEPAPDAAAAGAIATRPELPAAQSAARCLAAAAHLPFWIGSSALAQSAWPTVEPWFVRAGLVLPFVASNYGLTFCMRKELPPLFAAGRVRTLDLFERIRDAARAHDAALIVLVIPAAIQASEARYRDFVAARPAEERPKLDRTAFVRSLDADLRARGIVVVDPIETLEREEAAGRACYFREGHWNAHGHEVGADALVPALRSAIAARRR